MLTAREIRKRYLDFFERRKHKIVKSGPLIPPGDPSLLFTNAGMVQFKDYFLGDPNKPFTKASTCQKCLRVSGKHNDLENVGRTARHHTFFEMLGNFSFGDYFKKDAIAWAWEFVTGELGLPKDRLWVTIYKDDEEAFKIWKETAGLPDERIVRMGEKDNFWTMGDTGPCGPCSEIYIDQGEDMACGPDCGIGKCDCDRFLEIWNLVFTQFDQQQNGERLPLAAPNIDTGMGLERITAVCQGKRSNFDCDLFQDIIQYAAEIAGVKYSASDPDTNDIDTALRVIADHARAAAFLIAEGVLPSNEKRGYVLRRLIRRALRFATLMGVEEPFLYKVARKVTEVMGDAYPELGEQADFIQRAVYEEEKRFAQTLGKGLQLLDEEIAVLTQNDKRIIPGEVCFRLYDTYGFPVDIIQDIAAKRNLGVDVKEFENLMHSQRQRARESQKKSGLLGSERSDIFNKTIASLSEKGVHTRFIGYADLHITSPLLLLLNENGDAAQVLEEGERGYIIAESTPFYAESGGQASDSGEIRTVTGRAKVTDVIKSSQGVIIQAVEIIAGEMTVNEEAELVVQPDKRMATARNHTCTHLLHAALRKTLGSHVRQAGSLVDGEKLRFDFSHLSALTNEELAEIERQVNQSIMADLPVAACEMDKQEAIAAGAMALFSEKYGDRVRVLTIGEKASPESVELCGGTHLERTGQAGSFYIVSEGGVAAGVRRIEAVTGWNAYARAVKDRGLVAEAAKLVKGQPDSMIEKISILQDEIRKLRKDITKVQHSAFSGENLVKSAVRVGAVDFIGSMLPDTPIKTLRELMDDLRSRFSQHAVICLASKDNNKPVLLLYVSKDLQPLFTAPALLKELSSVCGGSGGGRADLAQAGGFDPGKVKDGFNALQTIIAEKTGVKG